MTNRFAEVVIDGEQVEIGASNNVQISEEYDTQACFLNVGTAVNDSISAYLETGTVSSDSQAAYVEVGTESSGSQACYVQCDTAVNDSQSAFLEADWHDAGNVQHVTLEGSDLHIPHYLTDTDPGAVGAGIQWVDTSSGHKNWTLKVRNTANDGWETVTGGLFWLDKHEIRVRGNTTYSVPSTVVRANMDNVLYDPNDEITTGATTWQWDVPFDCIAIITFSLGLQSHREEFVYVRVNGGTKKFRAIPGMNSSSWWRDGEYCMMYEFSKDDYFYVDRRTASGTYSNVTSWEWMEIIYFRL